MAMWLYLPKLLSVSRHFPYGLWHLTADPVKKRRRKLFAHHGLSAKHAPAPTNIQSYEV